MGKIFTWSPPNLNFRVRFKNIARVMVRVKDGIRVMVRLVFRVKVRVFFINTVEGNGWTSS